MKLIISYVFFREWLRHTGYTDHEARFDPDKLESLGRAYTWYCDMKRRGVPDALRKAMPIPCTFSLGTAKIKTRFRPEVLEPEKSEPKPTKKPKKRGRPLGSLNKKTIERNREIKKSFEDQDAKNNEFDKSNHVSYWLGRGLCQESAEIMAGKKKVRNMVGCNGGPTNVKLSDESAWGIFGY